MTQDRVEAHSSADAALVEALRLARLGPTRTYLGLALFPIYRDGVVPSAGYTTLATAIERGDAVACEKESPTVPTLSIENRGTLPILILDGEEIVGGRQNRVVNVSLLVPPATVFDLPVTCVEHGRWHETRSTFLSGEALYPNIRERKMSQVHASMSQYGAPRSDQGEIWNEIAQFQRSRGTDSTTGAVSDVYVDRVADLERASAALSCPDDGPIGIVATIGGRSRCADLFDRPETLRVFWTRLVRSYALEAEGAAEAGLPEASARRLLVRPLSAERSVTASTGLGEDVRTRGNGAVGTALVYEGAVVHLALFRQRRLGRDSGPVQGPSERARWHRQQSQ